MSFGVVAVLGAAVVVPGCFFSALSLVNCGALGLVKARGYIA
jgi:hypothetical protein